MKKIVCFVLTILMIMVSNHSFQPVKAQKTQNDILYLEILYSNTKCRTGPSTSYDVLSIDGVYQYYTLNEVLEVMDQKVNSSGELWYKVKKIIHDQEYQTWVREDFVLLYYYEYDEAFEQEISEQGFPASYLNYLRYLHTKQPTWQFVAFHTNIQWNDILQQQNVLGRSLVDGSNIYLRSKADGCYNPSTGQYIPLDGNNWYQANSQAIAYFMDPRNFINQEDIFQFVKLSFNENETPDVIQTILNGTFMSGSVEIEEQEKKYAQIFYDAAEEANVSAIYLATKARYEQGTTGSKAVTGEEFTYNGKTYSSLYNFFNIQATSGADNWKYGLIYANGGENGENTSYNRPWNNQEKAIMGGALWIGDGYISDGQDSLYTQKFNCVTQEYWHQYQTNIKAPSLESGSIYRAYQAADCLDCIITFTIPVYLEMPEKTYLPNESNPAEEPPTNPDPIDPEEPTPTPGGSGGSGSGSSEMDNQDLLKACSEFFDDYQLIESIDCVLGFQIHMKYQEIKKYVEEKGCSYQVRILDQNQQEVNEDTLLATGQILSIEINDKSMKFFIVIKGDTNGDGKISPVDYVLIKNHIIKTSEITERCQLLAADLSEDHNISPVDYVLVKNIILSGGN